MDWCFCGSINSSFCYTNSCKCRPSNTVTVQTSRWTDEDEIVTTNETWLESDYDEFIDDIEDAIDSGGANATLICEEVFDVYQEYEFVPLNKDLDDLYKKMEDLYKDNEEDIEDYNDTYGFTEQETYEYHQECFIFGLVYNPFYCARIPALFTMIHSLYGGTLTWYSRYDGEMDDESCTGKEYKWVSIIFIGTWKPPAHNLWNLIPKYFSGFTLELLFAIPYEE